MEMDVLFITNHQLPSHHYKQKDTTWWAEEVFPFVIGYYHPAHVLYHIANIK